MQLKNVMTRDIEVIDANATLEEAATKMAELDVGPLPVCDGDHLVGMVTDRDIVCKGLASKSFNAARMTARDVMTEGIHCCREDDDLAKAVHHMETLKIRRLPVINKSKRMVGMISLGDVSQFATVDLLTQCVKGVSAHH